MIFGSQSNPTGMAKAPCVIPLLRIASALLLIFAVSVVAIPCWTANSGSTLVGEPEFTLQSDTARSSFEHRTGDLDEMIKHRQIRALVSYSRTAFFYDNGHHAGISYEALMEFQRLLNREFKTGDRPISVTFLPLDYDQLQKSLQDGLGDLIAVPIAITPERETQVSFSSPIADHVTQIVVTRTGESEVSSLDDLSGKEVFVNSLTVYKESLSRLNEQLIRKGKKPVIIKTADSNLEDEDLLEMVNAGLIPATVTINLRATFWAKIFPHIHICSACVLRKDEQLAWAIRKDSPQLKKVLDQFVEAHRENTSFGDTLLRRYLQNTKWVENATSQEEMKKFHFYVDLFKKYAKQYDFDYLLLIGQGYQESQLNQDLVSPGGAVGLMQVIPKYAAASPINIPDVRNAEANIYAGTKMLGEIADHYFSDPKIDPLNRMLLTLASYNAGPNRIVALRRDAERDGLDPNKWFGNVELEVSKHVGQITVTYVSNIYKYYVAYRLVLEQMQERNKEEEIR